MAENQQEDHGDPSVVAWYFFLLIVSFAGGGVAVAYWSSIPYSGGSSASPGLAVIVMLVVFIFGGGIATGILMLFDAVLGRRFRMGIGLFLLLVLAVIYFFRDHMVSVRPLERDWVVFQAEKEKLQALKTDIPHAPPGVVPEMLEMRQDGDLIHVANKNTRGFLGVSVLLVTPRGEQFDRCWGAVEQLWVGTPKDASRADSVVQSARDRYPTIPAGHGATFSMGHCGKAYAAALPEFRVTDPELTAWNEAERQFEEKVVFWSDSAFVPDYPQLGK